MQCERCHIRSASVHIRDQTRGADTVTNLCAACATRSLGDGLAGAEVAKLIGDLVARLSPAVAASPTMDAARVPDPAVRCAVCGLSAKEFALLGRLGCPACYEALAAEVDGVLRATHRGAEHTGSRPRSSVDPALVPAQETGPAAVAEREVLRLELERAVAEEAFERAAEIRDALRRLQ